MSMQNDSSKFAGTWELVEWTSESADGRKEHPLGTDAIGRISYTEDGNTFVQIMRKERPQSASQDPLQGEPGKP